MIGQIQVCRLKIDAETARSAILRNKAKLIDMANSVDPILVKFGGGCRDVEARVLETDAGTMLIVHLLVDCRDAMGANAVNTMCDLGVPRCCGAFTPSTRVVSRRGGRGWFLFRF